MKIKHIVLVTTALLALCGSPFSFAQAAPKAAPKAAPTAVTSSVVDTTKKPTPQMLEAMYQNAWFTTGEKYWNEDRLSDWGSWEHKFDGKLKTEQDLDDALKQMVASLHDTWTTYQSSHERLVEVFADFRGIVNFGMKVRQDGEGNYFVKIAPFNSPARAAGLQAGDRIVSIAGKPLRGLKLEQVEALMEAPTNSSVAVVYAADDNVEHSITVKAVKLTAPNAEAKMLPDGVLYMRLSSYMDGSDIGLFNASVAKVLEGNATVTGVVFDLRGNAGGDFQLVLNEMSFFVPGKVIVSSETRNGNVTTTSQMHAKPLTAFELSGLSASNRKMIDVFSHSPMVVLVDGSTASAAEITTATLSENGRATSVGVNTFGKNYGFEEIDVPLGGLLTVTNLKYTTPQGTDVSDGGLHPQIFVKQGRDGVDTQLQAGLDQLRSISSKQTK
ncbi:hypothetical protein BH10CYA1_BH10CYA1_45100 [soil metagenome]